MPKFSKTYGIAMTALSLALVVALVAMAFVNAGLRTAAREARQEADGLRLALAAYGEADPALPASAQGDAPEGRADLLARVNGQDISLYEALGEYQSQAYYARMFGAGDEELNQLKADIAEGYVRYAILLAKCSELGFDVLTSEEYQRIGQEAQARYDEMFSYYLSDSVQGGMDEEEARAQTLALFAEQSYTVEALIDELCKGMILDRLYAHLTEGIELTEEALQRYYDQKLAADRQTFDESPLSFEYAVSENLVYTYVPKGFRSIKQILIRLTDEEEQRVADIGARLASIALEEQTPALEAERQALEAEEASIYAAYDERVIQIQSRLNAGESFELLIEEFGEDENMLAEPYRTGGYPVSADAQLVEAELVSAAMALTRPGEVSGPVRDRTGIHFLRYEGEVAPGAIPLAQVRDALSEEALIALRQTAYDQIVDAWYAQAQIELFLENLTEQTEQ